MTLKVWGSLSPETSKPVPRTTGGSKVAREWYFLSSSEKAYHAIGRTVERLQPLVTQDEVDALCEEYDHINRVRDLSISQQLDFLATEILRQDRAEHLSIHRHRQTLPYPYLSEPQWRVRVFLREMCFPSVPKLVELMDEPGFVVHGYENRITNLAFDKKGNLPYVWSRSPMKVGKDSSWEPHLMQRLGEE